MNIPPVRGKAWQWRSSEWLAVYFDPEEIWLDDYWYVEAEMDNGDYALLSWHEDDDRWEFEE